MTARAAWPWLVLLLAVDGCESDEDKCARLQGEAAAAWQGYAAVLAAGEANARRAYDAAKVEASALERDLEGAARKQADALYAPQSSAWWRAMDAAQQTLCSKHPQCMQLKAEMAENDQSAKELSGRHAAVREAIAAATAAAADPARSAEAQRVASAVEDDFDRPEIKPARAASVAAQQVCAALAR